MWISYEGRGTQARVWFAKSLIVASAVGCAAPEAWAQSTLAATTLPEVTIKEAPSVAQKYQLPATTESVTAAQMAESINVMNTEDALKYLPSLIVRGLVELPVQVRRRPRAEP